MLPTHHCFHSLLNLLSNIIHISYPKHLFFPFQVTHSICHRFNSKQLKLFFFLFLHHKQVSFQFSIGEFYSDVLSDMFSHKSKLSQFLFQLRIKHYVWHQIISTFCVCNIHIYLSFYELRFTTNVTLFRCIMFLCMTHGSFFALQLMHLPPLLLHPIFP